jgi:selenocysteine-specific elongation factor
MIIATAGHVDHGKTLLVKALTGVDADRLPEEKARGMTIDLGFAYLPVESGEPIGFIDVPGHERFIHNMLCGVAGIDFVLFIIAADDGPMPQTAEHLAILDLLDVPNGAIALTKVDRVSLSRVNQMQGEIAALLAGTALEGAPVFPVSAVTGEGIAELKSRLVRAARDCPPRIARGNFRLAIDRYFSIAGAGLVVTGTAVSGTVAVGDQIRVLQAKLSARVRTIHAQNTPLRSGRAGQRCALNLAGAGLKHDLIGRGDWVVTGGVPEPVSKLDARLRILKSEQTALAHWTPVHVHLAAADVTGRVAVLEESSIAPGSSALVQLVLDRPLGALRGDGFIIRDQSARRTIGGGRVIDIFPPVRGRARPERLAYLAAMENSDDQTALTSLLDAAPSGVSLSKFAANRNLTPEEADRLVASSSLRVVATSIGPLGFSRAHWDRLKATALETLAASHRSAPDTVGLNENSILGASGRGLPGEVAHQLAAELLREGAVVKEAAGVRLPSHLPKLDSGDAALWQKVAPLLEQNLLRPPAVHEIAAAIGQDPKKIESFLVRATRLGLLVRLSPNRFFRPEALTRLRGIAETIAAGSKDRLVTAAAFRDCTKIGRTVAIEVLEFFDRIKFTRRVGDAHQIIRPAGNAATQ